MLEFIGSLACTAVLTYAAFAIQVLISMGKGGRSWGKARLAVFMLIGLAVGAACVVVCTQMAGMAGLIGSVIGVLLVVIYAIKP